MFLFLSFFEEYGTISYVMSFVREICMYFYCKKERSINKEADTIHIQHYQ